MSTVIAGESDETLGYRNGIPQIESRGGIGKYSRLK